MLRILTACGLLGALVTTQIYADSVDDFLQLFSKNPRQAMNQPLGVVVIEDGVETLVYPDEQLSAEQKRALFEKRQELRELIMQRAPDIQQDKGPIYGNDNPLFLLGRQHGVLDIATMDRQSLLKGDVALRPWSGSYWPTYQGGIAHRYAFPSIPYSTDWLQFYNLFLKTPPQKILASGDSQLIDKLSPAEKYDLLVGDPRFSLTQSEWEQGKEFYEIYNHEVPTWFGICHGWAPASFSVKRPLNAVEVLAANGRTRVRFYPEDIKALVSQLWAKEPLTTTYAGGRCRKQDPEVDENGRVIDQECFDNNPATFHVAVVNSVGIERQSLVLDISESHEVWNQPIISYQYSYFNPQSLNQVASLEEARVAIKDFTADKFRRYRSPRAQEVVGIIMEITYARETSPLQRRYDSEEFDAVGRLRLIYDLELDAQGLIQGGEWYLNRHPDFMWRPKYNRLVYNALGNPSGIWRSTRSPVPSHWRQWAFQVSQQSGAPLAKIVYELVRRAQTETP